jgi:molybdopterin-guanine dinucleotide biosynthesis protein A
MFTPVFRQKEIFTPKAYMPMLPISCAILLGGKNSRMGGANKAFLRVDGKSILERMMEITKPMFHETIFISNHWHPELNSYMPDFMISDIIPERGPMSGIHAALSICSMPYCFVFACDLPNLSPELILKQCKIAEKGYDAIIPRHQNGTEPLHGLYSKKLVQPLENYLNSCFDNKIILFLETVNTFFWGVDYDRSFININTPDDLAKYLKRT